MKRFLAPMLISLSALVPSWGQGAREMVLEDPALAQGIYYMYSDPITAGTPAPRGYKPVYLSHYGRHGARYLVTERHYTDVLEPLEKAASEGQLTPLGQRLYKGSRDFYDSFARGRAGDLTPAGWEQHKQIAAQTVKAFPSLFRGSPRIAASASTTIRSIMSMQSFCLSLQQLRPRAQIYSQAGRSTLPWTLPEKKENASDFDRIPMPWSITASRHMADKTDCEAIVSRLFVSGGYVTRPAAYCTRLYNLLLSDGCTDGRIGVSPLELFTPDELFALWEEDNLETYVRVAGNLPCYYSMLEDIVSMASKDDAAQIPVRLRFGHDIGIDALAFMLGIDGADRQAATPDDVADIWPVWRTPMASTFLLVVYRSHKGEDLFKVILNGKEVSLSKLHPVSGPYYRWNDLKTLVLGVL